LNINDYIAKIEKTIHYYTIVGSYNLNIDRKTEDIAFLSGEVYFRDDSILDFKEFIERTDLTIEKYKYGYNYRIGSEIVFRYDNAPDPAARNLKSFPHHKHTAKSEIIESRQISLNEVLNEIETIMLNKLD
jgi:hypothetical protein